MHAKSVSMLQHILVQGDDDDGGGGEDGEEKLPSCSDYVMHFFTIFWKLLFAFVPPTGKSQTARPLNTNKVVCPLRRLLQRVAVLHILHHDDWTAHGRHR